MKNIFDCVLGSIEGIREFCQIATSEPDEVDVIVGSYMLDAKSILALCTIDPRRRIQVRICSESEETCREFERRLAPFIA